MSISTKESILLLFERPYEPIYFPKGPNGIVLRPPPELLSNREREVVDSLPSRFGPPTTTVAVAGLPAEPSTPVSLVPPAPGEPPLPDAILNARELPRLANFSVFVPWHRRLAGGLIELFMAAGDEEELRSLAVAVHGLCNPQLFVYALSVALLHRPDMRDLALPSFVSTMPGRFLASDAIRRAYLEANLTDTQREVVLIPRNWTANDEEPEHRLAYWREDVGINVHHWHWHLVYPSQAPRAIVQKDRRGEMFYYMHQQIIARYNFERFSVGLGRVRRLGSFREPLREGYYAKLTPNIARDLGYAGRPDNATISNVSRELERVFLDISDLERWETRIFDAIHSGEYINARGERTPLTEETGIDILGDIVEASVLTPNPNIYGDLHNMLHFFIGTCHDPTGKHQEQIQAVTEPATAMRDPVFYLMHAYIDDIFREYKNTLQPYSEAQLGLPGVALTAMSVQTSTVPGEQAPPAPGVLRTFLQESDIELSRGLDFAPRGPTLVRVQHLQNAPFDYTFSVQNATGAAKRVTVRVFLAPQTDERGIPLRFADHRNYFVEVDKFVATVAPGASELKRSSAQSSITIPWEQTFRDVDTNRPPDNTPQQQDFSFCSCGWPQHMLLPRGNAEGLPCVLFAMLTDYELDKVEGSESQEGGRCKAAVSFCGLRDKRFPDRRPMGFPFDRLPRNADHYLRQFMAALDNMRAVDVTVQFTNRVLLRRLDGAAEATPVTS
ncbi:hypothetical protein R5R35_013428 [Gryllus longicercus]|uniref:Tyrosinase copper-binding domain-containing protein n=1 Tax=Gryllus longicercus TaxID=2509291 RepID=A0AAN9VYN9_9ORTH